jgi:hypothetical protein
MSVPKHGESVDPQSISDTFTGAKKERVTKRINLVYPLIGTIFESLLSLSEEVPVE